MGLVEGKEIFPGIVIYENIIHDSEDIINFSLSKKNEWRDSMIVSKESGTESNSSIRNTRILDIPAIYSNDTRWFEISKTIWQYGNEYGKNFGVSFSAMEFLQILHYSAGEGFYLPHADDSTLTPRIFSALLYLNDVSDGGETYFNRFDVSISPKAGTLAIFPANYMYSHEARNPKSGDKFAIVGWFSR